MCTMYLQDCFILQGLEYITESKFRQNTFNQHILGKHMPTCTQDMQKRNTLPGHVPPQDDHLQAQQLSTHHTTEHQTMLHYQ